MRMVPHGGFPLMEHCAAITLLAERLSSHGRADESVTNSSRAGSA